jgi:HrpA-like RNA helicase
MDIVREEVAKYQDEEATIRCEEPRRVVAAELAKRVRVQRKS